MRKIAVMAGLLFAATFYAVDGPSVYAQTSNNQTTEVKNIVINKGDTLSKIAQAHATTYVRLFDANLHVKDPDVIFPGDSLRIPRADEVLQNRLVPADTPAVTPQVKPQTKPAQAVKPKSAAVANTAVGGGVWDRLAQCESGGNWSINTGNGYYGGLQFTLSSWRAVGGSGYPHQASKSEQIARAEKLRAIQGWGAWPACSRKLGLR